MHVTDAVDVPGKGQDDSSNTLSTSPPVESFVMDYGSPINNITLLNLSTGSREEDVPVELIPGERLEEKAEFLHCQVYLTNYRLVVISSSDRRAQNPISVESIPIVNIDTIDYITNESFQVSCKEARVFRFTTSSTEQSCHWYKKFATLASYRHYSSLFTWSISKVVKDLPISWLKTESRPEWILDEKAECRRWNLDPDYFKVVDFNDDYSICSSYPREMIMPSSFTRSDVESMSTFRMLGRIPSIAWSSKDRHTMLLRAAQPKCSVFLWRNSEDEKLFRCVNDYTAMKNNLEYGRLKIYDCRSYTASLGNRMKGGGSEREENYANCTLEYCNLPNIHNVRWTFDSLRRLFNPPVDQTNFLMQLQTTNWFINMVGLLQYSNKVADQLIDKGVNVLVHCSDGWDRTTQLITLAKILIDPYYRTMKGFEELIRRDWIAYGHKFADRNGMHGTDVNERCPVFLQWLDSLHQIYMKNSNEFEFSMAYLVKLACHVSSGLFTSFIFNTVQEMEDACTKCDVPPLPIWRLLNSDECYENALYDPSTKSRLIAPDNIQSMRLWNEVYRCHEVETLLASNTTSPSKDIDCDRNNDSRAQCGSAAGDREWKENRDDKSIMERSLVKSRSSESISSTNDTLSLCSSQHRNNGDILDSEMLDNRERRGTRSSIGGGCHNDTIVGVGNGGGSPPTTSNNIQYDMKTILDCDGLVRFKDQTQETARKKFQEHKAQVKKEDERRRRLTSEMSDLSIGYNRSGDDLFHMEDTLSDASVVDAHEIAQVPRMIGFAVNQTKCALCKYSFGYIKKRCICKACGRAFCDGCSSNRYKDVIDGVSKDRRACDECFNKMNESSRSSISSLNRENILINPSSSSSSPSTPSSSSNGTSSSGRNCPDGQSRSPVGYLTNSQAVKG